MQLAYSKATGCFTSWSWREPGCLDSAWCRARGLSRQALTRPAKFDLCGGECCPSEGTSEEQLAQLPGAGPVSTHNFERDWIVALRTLQY